MDTAIPLALRLRMKRSPDEMFQIQGMKNTYLAVWKGQKAFLVDVSTNTFAMIADERTLVTADE